MSKILFIVPPYVSFDSFVNPAYNERTIEKKSGNYGHVATDMPVGLLSLSAYSKKHMAVEVKLIDFNITLNKIESFEYNSFAELFRNYLSAKEWIDFTPDIIGITSILTLSYYNMIDIAQVSQEIFPDSTIIAGGGVPTNMYNEIFQDSTCFDALCYGEGEKPLFGLLKATDKEKFLNDHQSWITREKVESKQSFQYDFIENLDEIPFYDYDILKTDEYRLNPSVGSFTSFDDNKYLFHIDTSRGCPYHCCFCASHSVHGRTMRYHSINRVREDLKHLKDQYRAETIVIQDDNLMSNKKRVFDIIDILRELKLNVFFQSGLAIYGLDRKMLEALKNIGVNQLILATESGSKRVLKEIMHKPVSLTKVRRVVEDCRQLGIDTDANILIGLPGETKQDIEDARAFLKTLDVTWFRVYIATPLVGSEMFDIVKEKEYSSRSYNDFDFKRAGIETEDFTAEYIQEMSYFLNLELNFVANSDFRLGNYETALKNFENTIRVRSDHAFAYYFAAKCCKIMNLEEKYSDYKTKYEEAIWGSEFWKVYANQFNLTQLA